MRKPSGGGVRRSPRRHRQRGASGLFMVLLLGMLLLFAALSIDTGRLMFAKRQLQVIADAAALDAARVTGPCSGQTVTDPEAVLAAARAAAANGYFLGADYAGDPGVAPNSVTLGTALADPDTHIRGFVPVTDPADAAAVQVVLSEAVQSSLLLPGLGAPWGGTTTLTATAVGQSQVEASFSAASYLASLDSSQSAILNAVLNALLGGGGGVALDAVSYQGLVATDVKLGDLVAAAGVGTVEELLALDLTLPGFLTLVASALTAGGDNAVAVVVNDIAAGANAGSHLVVEDLLALDLPAAEGALDASFNVMDLVSGGLQLANKGNAINIPGIAINAAPLATVDLSLHIIEAPRLNSGPPGLDANDNWRTEVHTSQVAVNVEAHSTPTAIPVGLQTLTTTADLALFLQAGQTSAHLKTIDCGGLLEPVHAVTLGAEPGIARVGVGHLADPANPGSAINPSPVITLSVSDPLLGSATIPVTVAADLPLASPGAQDRDYTVDELLADPLPQQQTVGTNAAAATANAVDTLAASTTVSVGPSSGTGVLGTTAGLLTFLGIGDLSAVAMPVASGLVEPLLVELAGVLEVVQGLLGVNLGGADLTLISVLSGKPTLLTGQPELVI